MARDVDHLVLPPMLSSVARARALMAGVAQQHAFDPVVAGDAALVVSELVTNAVLHAGTTVELTVGVDGSAVLVEVTDASTMPVSLPQVGLAPPTIDEAFDEPVDVDVEADLDAVIDALSMTGRGMELVAAIAAQWGVTAHAAGGKTVWAEVSLVPVVVGPASAVKAHGAGAGGRAPSAPAPSGPAGTGAPRAGAGSSLRLVAVPVRLVSESARDFDDTVRELQVMSLSDGADPHIGDLARTATQLVGELRASRPNTQETVRLAVERGDRLIDMEFGTQLLPPRLLRGLDALMASLAAARSTGRLLVMAPTPEVVEFRVWLREEVERQVAGEVPRACPFPAVRPTGTPPPSDRPLSGRRHDLLVGLEAELSVAPDRRSVARAAVERVVADAGAAWANLLLVEPDGAHLASLHRLGYPPGDPIGLRFALSDDNPAPEAVRTAQPVVLRTGAERSNRYPQLVPSQALAGNPTSVWLPLGGRAPADGVLVVGFPRARDFSAADLRYLLAVADVIHRRLTAVT